MELNKQFFIVIAECYLYLFLFRVEEKDRDVVQFDLVDMSGGQTVLEVSLLPHHAVPLRLLHVAPHSLQDPTRQAREVNQLPLFQIAKQIN